MIFKYIPVIISLVSASLFCNAKTCDKAVKQLEEGKILYENERYSEATTFLLNAMKMAKEQGDVQTYTKGLYNLGMVYVRMDDMERALYYFSMCYERAKNTGDEVMQGKCAAYMATCYAFIHNLDMTRKYFSLQQQLPNENENMKQYFLLYNSGLICFLEKKYDKATQMFHLAIECVKRHQLDNKYLQSIYGLMVYIQVYKNNTEEALRCCEEYTRAAQDSNKRLWKEAYYEMLSDMLGTEIHNEYDFITEIKDMAEKKKFCNGVINALDSVKNGGYGLVMPEKKDITLETPELIKAGNKYGVKIKAEAPSVHMIKANITTEIAPIVGTKEQAEDLVEYIKTSTGENGEDIWDVNIFGKSIEQLVEDGLNTKTNKMNVESKQKLQDTMEKIVNDGNGGLVCIII